MISICIIIIQDPKEINLAIHWFLGLPIIQGIQFTNLGIRLISWTWKWKIQMTMYWLQLADRWRRFQKGDHAISLLKMTPSSICLPTATVIDKSKLCFSLDAIPWNEILNVPFICSLNLLEKHQQSVWYTWRLDY